MANAGVETGAKMFGICTVTSVSSGATPPDAGSDEHEKIDDHGYREGPHGGFEPTPSGAISDTPARVRGGSRRLAHLPLLQTCASVETYTTAAWSHAALSSC
jgi:hypothetical protein